jgi:hypothetical protein
VIPAENVRDWRGHAVVDHDGSRIGELEAVYVDTTDDEPAFATVKLGGLFARTRLAFVPLAGAVVTPDHLKVAFSRQLVRDAPSIDADGELLAEDEPAVFNHYGMDHATGARGERRLARR